jgi:hypothetical protein
LAFSFAHYLPQDEILYGDYGQTISVGSTTPLSFLQGIANATQILGNLFISNAFCSVTSIANKSDALSVAFSSVREIHGYLQVSQAFSISQTSCPS